MIFTSDNAFGVAPEILEALGRVNGGGAASYGEDEITKGLQNRFSDVFERDVAVFPVATGTAANSLALATLTPPYGAILCHEVAHVNVDECGAPEMFSGGAKLIGIGGSGGKINSDALVTRLESLGQKGVHQVQPRCLTITQSNEAGGIYSLEELRRLTGIARDFDLKVHMDGARFANALVSLGCSPAEMTWKLGVDVLSFGATKNGAMAAEAVVFFDPALVGDFEFRRKRAGHLFSKMRFLSVQLEAYLKNDLWLKNARHANAAAKRMADGLKAIEGIELVSEVAANEVFAMKTMKTLVALTMLSTLGLSGAAYAAGDAKTACRADYEKLCKDTQPGGGRIMKCLKANEDQLSQPCKDAMAGAEEKMMEKKEQGGMGEGQ